MSQSNILNIVLTGPPIAKERSRRGRHGNWYNPQEDVMVMTRREIKAQLPNNFMIHQHVPVICKINAFFAPPKAKDKQLYVYEDVPCLNKVDGDNVLKYYIDAMSKKLVYYDDNQVYGKKIFKWYSKNPRVEIEVMW